MTMRSHGTGLEPPCLSQGVVSGVTDSHASRPQTSWQIETVIPWVTDASSRTFAYVGSQASAILGYPLESWSEPGFWAARLHPEDHDFTVGQFALLSRTRDLFQLEYRMIAADGAVHWFRDNVHVCRDENGEPHGFNGYLVEIDDLKTLQARLEVLLEFERKLSQLSATFIDLPPERVDKEVDQGLELIARTFLADRITLAQLDVTNGELRVTHSWSGPGIPKVPPVIVRQVFPWIFSELESGRTIKVTRVADLPLEATKEREYAQSVGQKATLTFPFSIEGSLIGALAVGCFRTERDWEPETIRSLRLAAEIFANAIERKQKDARLQVAYSEIQRLKDRLEKENTYLREEITLEHHHRELLGQSEAIRRVLKQTEQVGATNSTVLITGETGTGKELVARTIHELSRCKGRAMVKVNCAALPATLVESELFGREKGAYTGALTREIGRFEFADDSTIFLDEVGELPLELQAKLLRVLQEGEFERLGSPRTVKVNVRVIAATSRDLSSAIKEGKFREDLFYRLNVFPIHVPALRERTEDIPALTWHFVREIGLRMGRNIESIRSKTMDAFTKYPWPGNVRELRNIVERSLIVNPGPVFRAELPRTNEPSSLATCTMEEMERRHILEIMKQSGWKIRGRNGAAQILAMKPTTLESRMKKLRISRVD